MGQGAFGAVAMYRVPALKYSTLFGVDTAIAVYSFAVHLLDAVIIISKVWTAAQIAIEFVNIMAFLVHAVERTKVRMCTLHIVIIKIGDHFIVA